MNASDPFRVGDWIVKPSLNLVANAKRSVRLEPRAMDLLVYLCERQGEVVSTDRILAEVWRGRVVEDSAVYKRVNQLRKAFGDEARNSSVIETVPRRGYRLIAPVGSATSHDPLHGKVAARPPRWNRWSSIAGVAALLIVTASVLIAGIGMPDSLDTDTVTRAAPSEPVRIAVPPFETIGDTAGDSFVSGLHAELLTGLTGIRSLQVIGSASVAEYGSPDTDLQRINRETGADVVLRISLQRSDQRLRLHARLVDTRSGASLWAESFNYRLSARNLLAVQTDIATAILSTLSTDIDSSDLLRLETEPTDNPLAYDYYLSGRGYAARWGLLVSPALAVDQFEKAVAEDPDFALAWAALSVELSNLNRSERDAGMRARARAAADRALALDPELGEAYFASAWFELAHSADIDRALRDGVAAERLLPGQAEPLALRAAIEESTGQWTKALATYQAAVELDPRNVQLLHPLASAHLMRREYDRAELFARRALDITPDATRSLELRAHIAFGRNGDLRFYRELSENPAVEPVTRNYIGWQLAIEENDYDRAFAHLNALSEHTFVIGVRPLASFLGLTYELAGDPNRARDQFETARAQIEEAMRDDRGDSPQLRLALAETLARVGEAGRAVDLAQEALDKFSARNALGARELLRVAAVWVFIPAGELEAAYTALDDYLSGPGAWSIDSMQTSTRLNAVHDDPGFLALVEKHGTR